jgi:hypothetical protein
MPPVNGQQDDVIADLAAGGQGGHVVEAEMDAAHDPTFARLVGRLAEADEQAAVARHVVRADGEV